MANNQKKDPATYHIEGCIISGYTMGEEQASVLKAIASGLEQNAKALGELAKSAKGPENVHMDCGIRIEGK